MHDDPPLPAPPGGRGAQPAVGPAWDLATSMGPLIRPPEGPLLDAFTRLGPGERWLVRPSPLDEQGLSVVAGGQGRRAAAGSPFHLTECFGPVLGIMRAADLDEAIRWQNQPAYGLTAGLHALDPVEIERWRTRCRPATCTSTGAPPGPSSGVSPSAGGSARWSARAPRPAAPTMWPAWGSWPVSAEVPARATVAGMPRQAWDRMRVAEDPTGLAAEANAFRYRPLRRVLLCRGAGVTDAEMACARAAAPQSGASVEVVERGRRSVRRPGEAGVDKIRCLPGSARGPDRRDPAGRPRRRVVGGRHSGRRRRRPRGAALGARAGGQ